MESNTNSQTDKAATLRMKVNMWRREMWKTGIEMRNWRRREVETGRMVDKMEREGNNEKG